MDNIPSNLRKYHNHLSPFGQKVLRVLVNEWSSEKKYNENRTSLRRCENEDQQSTYSSHSGYRQAKRLYSVGRDNNSERAETTNNYFGRKKCHLKFIEKEIAISPTPFDLLHNSVTKQAIEEQDIVLCRNDLDTSAIKLVTLDSEACRNTEQYTKNKADAIVPLVNNIDLGINYVCTSSLDSKLNVVKNDVSWNNMFDIELFKDEIDNDEIYKIGNENSTLESKIISNPDEKFEQTFKKPNSRAVKRNHSTKNVDHPSKKERKIIPLPKNIYKKEKYTKTVKNWLNDIEHTLKDKGDCNHEAGYVTEQKTDKNAKTDSSKKNSSRKRPSNKKNLASSKPEPQKRSTFVEKENDCSSSSAAVSSKSQVKKKAIQAQLANKDGKMKFKMPKNLHNDEINDKSLDASSSGASGTIIKEIVKEKKTKSKFVAPIKSQIPVKDISFIITRIDGSNFSDLGKFCKGLENAEIFVILIYSNGFSQLNGCYTEETCIPEGLLFFIAESDAFYYFTNISESCRTMFAQLLERNTIICYEGKNILIVLSHFNMKFNLVSLIDTKIGGALLDPENPPETFSDLQKLVGFTPEFTIATDCSLQKAAWYSTLLRDCAAKLKTALVDNSLWSVFVDIEMRLLPIIADMESRGVAVDMDKLNSMEQLLITKLKAVEQDCHRVAGRSFQINSPLQVRALLFDELKLDAKCNVKIGETLVKGAKSTSEATLRSLMSVHELPKLILEYRHLHKAHATFLTGIAHHVKGGVVRPTWVQIAAATGRIASNNPNLQAIPKAPFSLVMFPESDDGDNPSLSFRSVYISRPGHTLLAADFKHVECRVFAHAARDAALLAALQSDDLFRVLAAQWLNKTEEAVSNADREQTKRVVYASLYGCGARKLADMLAVGYEQALAVLASFNRTFPSLKAFGRRVVSQCERDGKLSTLCGRARSFKHITSTDFAAKSHAERQAVNFVVQGSAADLCKLAMIRTEERLRATSVRARLVLQIHDELVWEVHDDDVAQAAAAVKDAMESAGAECGAPRLPVAIARGRRWGQLRPEL